MLFLLLSWHERIVIGLVLMLAGGGLAYLAVRELRTGGTNPEPWKPSAKLVTSGVFHYVRNPIYLGGWIVVTGLAILLASDWMLVMLILSVPFQHVGVVLREERYLERKFGEAYRTYTQAVPRYGWPF